MSLYNGGLYSLGSSSSSSSTKYSGGSYKGLVATRGKCPGAFSNSFTQFNSRSIHVARTDITNIGVALANWYAANGSGGEAGTGNNATVTVQVEYPLGSTPVRITFGGSNTGTIYDFTTLESDLIGIGIPNASLFAIRYFYTNPAGIVFNDDTIRARATWAGECFEYAASGLTDRTGASGTFTSTSGGAPISSPVAVIGTTNLASYAVLGDSRVEGYLDDVSASLYAGEIERTVGLSRAFTNLARASETIQTVMSANGYNQRSSIINKYATHLISNYGVNDLFNNNLNANQLMNYLISFRNLFPNKYFYQNTIMGETNSTDVWATVGNQTTKNSTNENSRKLVCNWLRSTFHPFDEVFDICSTLESSQNSGKWQPPYTGEGIHENLAGYSAIASANTIKVY